MCRANSNETVDFFFDYQSAFYCTLFYSSQGTLVIPQRTCHRSGYRENRAFLRADRFLICSTEKLGAPIRTRASSLRPSANHALYTHP